MTVIKLPNILVHEFIVYTNPVNCFVLPMFSSHLDRKKIHIIASTHTASKSKTSTYEGSIPEVQ